MKRTAVALAAALALTAEGGAQAYVGLGAVLATLGVILGIVLSAGLALVAVVWYPVKRMRGRGRRARTSGRAADGPRDA